MEQVVFLDIGKTLLIADMLSPPKAVAHILHLKNYEYNGLRKIIFCRNHTNVFSLINDLEKYISRKLSFEESSQIVDLWDKQKRVASPIDGAQDFINWLDSGPFKVHLVSNLWYPFWEAFVHFFPALIEKWSVTLSFNCGFMKPHKGIYKQALKEAEASPSQVIMIGDSFEKDILPAVEMGMKAIWIQGNQNNSPKSLIQYKHLIRVATDLFDIKNNILNKGDNLCLTLK